MKKVSFFVALLCAGGSAFAAAVSPDLLLVAIKANVGALAVVGGACLLVLVLKVAVTRWMRRVLFKRGYLKIMPKQSSVVRIGKERFRRPSGAAPGGPWSEASAKAAAAAARPGLLRESRITAVESGRFSGKSKMDRVMRPPSGERVVNVLAAPGSYVGHDGKVRVWGSAPSSRKGF